MIKIVDGKPYLNQVKELIQEYTKWLGRDLSFQNLDKELADISEKYTAPNGGIAGHLLELVKEAYKSYLYINVMIGESKNAPFYEKHGFNIKDDSLPMQYRNVPKYMKR